MFEKLLATLPFNPSLIHQLSFYGQRMREEQSIRRIGLAFVALAFLVQFVAVFSPPQPTNADPSNDLVSGGISSATQAVTFCQQDIRAYGTIMSYYGISCDDVARSTVVSLRSTDYNKQLYSMGHLPYKIAGETPVSIPYQGQATPFYWRYLWGWDTHAYSTYTALKLTSHVTGKTFFILYNCGNLVSIGLPSPPPAPKPAPTPQPTPPPTPAPKPTPHVSHGLPCPQATSSSDTIECLHSSKTASNQTAHIANADGTTAHAGDIINYTLSSKNTGNVTVKKFVIQENMSDVLEYATITNLHGGKISSDNIVSWPAQDITPGQTATEQITIKVKDPIPQTPTSDSNPGAYDLMMTNVYGNAINIKLPGGIVKTVEVVATKSLPNTGPGTSIIISAVIVLLAGYFFARARLLSREANIIVHETNTAGGI
jgi:uncharacterized repeat protein (TIGR01451 family)